ncbi:MAG TPA: hypothetical protein VHF25_14640 [Nitriliruptorales bacterium]|nr:hypothetical protein [Nitriliruptorales bacterium]
MSAATVHSKMEFHMNGLKQIRRGRRRAVVAAAAVALVIASCEGGGQDVGGDVATPTPTRDDVDIAAFCDAAIEGESLLRAGPELDEQGNPTEEGVQRFSEQLGPLLEDLERNAPQEISSEVDAVVENVRRAVDEGDSAATQTPEHFQADAAIDDYVFENCELDAAQEITGEDYAFNGVPATLSAGQVGIRLDNQGREVHEAVIFRINDDVEENIEELLQLPQEQSEAVVEFKGVAFAEPDSTGSTVIDLEAGRYGVVCFIPVGTTSLDSLFAGGPEGDDGQASPGGPSPTGTGSPTPDESPVDGESPTAAGTEGPGEEGPPHFTRGMFAEFEVN